ncbi:MAG TPA: isoaspartyl peptidase/L-asparaginase, partial [Flavobacteriales bacterium]|nr:isoaspartyl peptidase/L-asparaginase [Flavobacteriales bacterium]
MGRTRREFLKTGSAAALGTVLAGPAAARGILSRPAGAKVISTWQHGLQANEAAWNTLGNGGSILDAVELGVAAVESDLTNRSVGLGGRPDRDGHVTLDACIQDHAGRAGAVAFVEHFEHPISIARAVMERTPHVMLVGEGAERWALENGFTRKEVDLPEVRKAWQEWLKTSDYKPVVNVENHDTIGMVGV